MNSFRNVNLSVKNKIIPILLCGGSGSRLWPISRKSFPKQFLKCNPFSDKSFLQDTILRLNNINNLGKPILICNEEHRFIAAEQMREIEITPESIILESVGRNTAPAIALGIIKARLIEKDPILLILAADHFIENVDEFIETINKGVDYAKLGKIVNFGIKPTSPETGFGYIKAENSSELNEGKGSRIKKFIEKPSLKKAQKLILSNKYFWNSGIFLGKANVLFDEMSKLTPFLICQCEKSLNESYLDLDFLRVKEDVFSKCPDISFDIAIMEKTNLGIILSLDIKWNDIGSWDAMSEISKKDKSLNSLIGRTIIENAKNCYLRSESKLIVGIDIEDLIVIETHDAILISKKNSSQKVKNIVEEMKKNNFKEATQHRKIFRPWGSYFSMAEGINWQVKRINVNPGESLSLQKHNYRTEHWVIVSGEALVEVGQEKKKLFENQSVYIPLACKHRLSNPGEKPLTLIEVQSGSYLGEDDIIRYEDNYGRENISNDF